MMNITLVDTQHFYTKACTETVTEDQFKYEVMAPVKEMWEYLNAPMTAKTPGGYDVVMASEMLGIWTPRKSTDEIKQSYEALRESGIYDEAAKVIKNAIQQFEAINYTIPLEDVVINILLGDKENTILMASEGYSGFGGIPGYILLIVVPNAFNKTRLKSALAHEFNHNVRFTHEPFNHGDVTVGEYIVIEGLAEVFTESLYGIENRGPWVCDYDEEEMDYTIEVFKDSLDVKGFEQVAAYMYGDEVAKSMGYLPVGVSRNAGYTIGYHVVKRYLEQTGQTIAEATLTSAKEILEMSGMFK